MSDCSGVMVVGDYGLIQFVVIVVDHLLVEVVLHFLEVLVVPCGLILLRLGFGSQEAAEQADDGGIFHSETVDSHNDNSVNFQIKIGI